MPQLAGAAFGANRSLEEIVAQRLAAAALEQQIAERQQRFGLEQERVNEARTQNQWERGRADKLDAERAKGAAADADAAAADRRGLSNMAGVMSMGLDPQTAKREIAYSARDPKLMMEAIEPPPPPKQYPVRTVDARGNPIHKLASEDEMQAGVPEYREPKTGPKMGTHVINGKLVDDTGKVIYEGAPGAGGGPSAYSQERSTRTLQSVDELMGKISGKTAGWGNLAAGIPASDAMNFESELDTLKANIAFNELTAMREASKTGGALGQVSNIELQLLESALGALNPRQSPENLRSQLSKIKESVQRWQAAQTAPSPASSHGQTPPAAGPAPRRMRFDRTGKPIP